MECVRVKSQAAAVSISARGCCRLTPDRRGARCFPTEASAQPSTLLRQQSAMLGRYLPDGEPLMKCDCAETAVGPEHINAPFYAWNRLEKTPLPKEPVPFGLLKLQHVLFMQPLQ